MVTPEYVLKRMSRMENELLNWHSHYDNLMHYIIPSRNFVFNNTKGDKKNTHLFDSTALRAARKLASAMAYLLINPSTQWLMFTTGNTELDENVEVSKWLQRESLETLRVYARSNFYKRMQEFFLELVHLGTGGIRQEEDPRTLVNFLTDPAYRFFVEENYKREIDTIYRKYDMTIRQLVQQFGMGFVKDNNMQDVLKNRPDKTYEVVHAVEPRMDYQMSHRSTDSGLSLPIASYHVLKVKKYMLKEGGFEENPWTIGRWSTISDEKYGRSPSMDVLPDVKTCNAMKKTYLKSAQLNMAPPLQVPDNGLMRPIKFKPYGVNYRRGKEEIKSLFTGGNVRIDREVVNDIKQDIREGYFYDQLKMVENDRMTATEIIQRRDEQFREFGGILIGASTDIIEPMVTRTFNIRIRRGLVSEPPQELIDAGIETLDIRMLSLIAKAQRAAEAESFPRAMEASMSVIQLQPDSADLINGDEVIKGNFEKYSVDPKYLKSDKEVKKIRKERAQAQERLAQEESNMAQAEMASKFSKAEQ